MELDGNENPFIKGRKLAVKFYGSKHNLGNEGPIEDFGIEEKISGKRLYCAYELHTFELDVPKDLSLHYTYYVKAYLDLLLGMDVLKVTKVEITDLKKSKLDFAFILLNNLITFYALGAFLLGIISYVRTEKTDVLVTFSVAGLIMLAILYLIRKK